MQIPYEVQRFSKSKKRKLEAYLQCKDLRAFACEKYRELIRDVSQWLEQNQHLTDTTRAQVLRLLNSPLRCEECGRGASKHTRPGLIVLKKCQQWEQEN